MIDEAPTIFLSGHVPSRLDQMIHDFSSFLVGETPGVPANDSETAQLELAGKLLPNVDDTMRLVQVRLISHFVNDPDLLLERIVPRHYEILASYSWFIPGQNGAPVAENDEAREGYSMFWLLQGRNQQLDNQEVVFRTVMEGALRANRWQMIVVRALLRLQAFHMDMNHIAKVVDIWNLAPEAQRGADYQPNLKRREPFMMTLTPEGGLKLN